MDPTSDLFALGMTALHLLTRRPPWELFADDPEALPKHLNVSVELRRFLERLTARQRNKRIPSARRALVELARATEEEPRNSRWLLPAVAAAAGVLLALTGLVAGRPASQHVAPARSVLKPWPPAIDRIAEDGSLVQLPEDDPRSHAATSAAGEDPAK